MEQSAVAWKTRLVGALAIGSVFVLGAAYGYMVHRSQWWPHPGPDREGTLTAPLAEAIDGPPPPPDPGPLRAANYLVNASFESRDLSHWTVASDVSGAVYVQPGGRQGGYQTSVYAATPVQASLSQMPDPAPATYDLSVWVNLDGAVDALRLYARGCAGAASREEALGPNRGWTQHHLRGLKVVTSRTCEVGLYVESGGGASLAIDEFVLGLASTSTGSGFVHPGLLTTASELAVLADRIENTPSQASARAYADVKSAAAQGSNAPPAPRAEVHVLPGESSAEESAFKQDALTAYASALIWALEGDEAAAHRAIESLDAWASTFERIVSTGFEAQIALEAAWVAPMWANAAELIRHAREGAAAWPDDDVQRFSEMLDRLWDSLSDRADASNRGASTAMARMAIGVFQDRRDRFDIGVSEWRHLLPRVVGSNGEVNELARDCWHPQFSLAAFTQGAEIAWHQGTDLFATSFEGDQLPRLARGSLWFADLLLGAACGGTPPEPGYEIALNHYEHRAALGVPILRTLVETRVRPEPASLLFLGLGSVTHAEVSRRR